jgi:amidase
VLGREGHRFAEAAQKPPGRYLWESKVGSLHDLWNITGQPAVSVPAGHSTEGLPLAVQLLRRPSDERTLLSLAAHLESERPLIDRWPPIS